MTDTVITVTNLSKRYRIGLKEEIPDTLAGALTGFVRSPLQNLKRLRALSTFQDQGDDPEDVIWALKEVSFEVRQGEVVGIIGRNGAGKSTLLKILSRITRPTSGEALIEGRVSSLLEVGTGFHPELTGRENIYLNGIILGMRKAEVDRKFDEMVEFSGVEKFIDTPVKRYSSGMKVRLAFSVAAHLEPEILIIDEVLAVGDTEFQKKCLGKMQDVAGSGRTVLFVSHNMAAVLKLCQTGLVLDQGYPVRYKDISDAVAYYTQMMGDTDDEDLQSQKDIAVQKLIIGGNIESFDASQDTSIIIHLIVKKPFWYVKLLLLLRNAEQVLLLRAMVDSKILPELCSPGTYRLHVNIPPLWLSSGQYSCHVKVLADSMDGRVRYLSDPLIVNTVMYDFEDRVAKGSGLLSPRCTWTIQDQ